MTLASYMVVGAGKASDIKEAERMLQKTIEEGTALEKMVEFVEAQGGNAQWIRHPELFPKAELEIPVYPKENGYLSACRNSEVGMACFVLGGGRETKESEIDLTVGIRLVKHLGDAVSTDEPFAYLYGNEETKVQEARERLMQAYTISPTPAAVQPIIKKIILE